MRGGLRHNWRRGLQLMVLTVLTNALRHAEEIVLAAEVRAFRPELIRKVSLRIGSLDGWVVGICILSLILVVLFV
jgi:energy-coupling factor transporter transmembrane protein EcfT